MFRSWLKFVFCTSILHLLCSCQGAFTSKNRVVVIQPLGNFPVPQAKFVKEKLSRIHTQVLLRPAIAIPQKAYYKPRNRFRADSIIRFLRAFGSADTVVIGLTNKDISVTKNKFKDWGVMGLAFMPGKACVVSTFRLHNKNLNEQFYKVAIHELGHTQGLPHCKIKSCLMRDAEGKNPLDEEKDFCKDCKRFLKSKGWKL